MKMSDTIAKIAPALLQAQKDMEGAKKGAANPFFKSKYADYSAVLEACKIPLNENGITILQGHAPQVTGDSVTDYVETTLLHSSGEYMVSLTPIICAKRNDPQALGSAITYARRYGLQSFIALPAEDDDAERAMSRDTRKPTNNAPARPTVGAPNVQKPSPRPRG